MKAAIEVLLVDDNPGDVELTAQLLQKRDNNMRIYSVSHGVEAMIFLRSRGKYSAMHRPSLVLLDLNMPRRDGWTVLTDVKADCSLHSIPVVVFSTSASQADIVRCYELGANSYVTKPGTLSAYAATVAAIGNYWFGCANIAQQEGQ
jgi:two-component system, chemotaxis family, response regulator Rcp1